MNRFSTIGIIASLSLWISAGAAEYAIDLSHSAVIFKIRHLGISTVTGHFMQMEGSFDVDPKNIAATKGSVVIKAASINTNNAKRDGHLQGDDFFNSEKFPDIKFASKSVRNVNIADSTCELVGDLTIRDVTREIVLKVKGQGLLANDGWGNARAAFHATGKIDRFDYNLKWNKAIETGSLVAGREVELELEFEGVRPLAPAPAGKPAEKAKPTAAPKTGK